MELKLDTIFFEESMSLAERFEFEPLFFTISFVDSSRRRTDYVQDVIRKCDEASEMVATWEHV